MECSPLLTGVQKQPVVPGTGGEKNQHASLHVTAEAHLEAQVVLLVEGRRSRVTPDPAGEFQGKTRC
jgi:hypothetical protein